MQSTHLSVAASAYSQGLSIDQMNVVFVGLIVSRLLYALPAWGVLVSAVRLVGLMLF